MVLGHGSCTSVEQPSRAVLQTVVFRLHDLEKGEMSFL
jgi:hypothetical protein